MFTYLKKEEGDFLQIEYIEMDTIGQQQAVLVIKTILCE